MRGTNHHIIFTWHWFTETTTNSTLRWSKVAHSSLFITHTHTRVILVSPRRAVLAKCPSIAVCMRSWIPIGRTRTITNFNLTPPAIKQDENEVRAYLSFNFPSSTEWAPSEFAVGPPRLWSELCARVLVRLTSLSTKRLTWGVLIGFIYLGGEAKWTREE